MTNIKRESKELNIKSNILVALVLLVISFVLYILQANIFPRLTIFGVMPNLFIIFILVIGLFGNNTLSIIFSIICGLGIDFLYGEVIGITPAMLVVIGFMATLFDSLWSKDEKISIVIMVIIATFIFELGSYFLKAVMLGFNMEMLVFLRILVLEILYNALLTIIFFGVIKKLGYAMERRLKRNNMYTVNL